MPTIHLPYGGSTAKRTLACPGWLKASEGIKPRPAGPAAIEGSMHHEVQEKCRKEVREPSDYIGLVYQENETELVFTEDDLDLSYRAYNDTETILDEHDIETLFVEPFVQVHQGKVGGSIDLLGFSADEKTALVLDYKFGSDPVPVENSAQHFLYTWSAMVDGQTRSNFDKVETIIFAVVQPKVKGGYATWSASLDDVTDFAEAFEKAMRQDTVKAGSHCKYCPAEPYCKERKGNVYRSKLLNPLLAEQLNDAAAIVEDVEAWVKTVKEELFIQMNRGVDVQGWKLVEKRATRKWIDDAEQRACFIKLVNAGVDEDELYKRDPLTAPQTEKIIKKHKLDINLDEYVEKKSSGLTIAPEADSAEAVKPAAIPQNLEKLVKEGSKK